MRKVSRARARCVASESSANPLLLFTALFLLAVLGCVEIDLHSDSLKGLGAMISSDVDAPQFAAP